MIQFFNKKMSKKRKGFTLIELVVVIAILGILAALAIPRFTNVTNSAKDKAVLTNQKVIASAVQMYMAENDGALPTQEDHITPFLNGQTMPTDTPAGATYTVTYAQVAAGTDPAITTVTVSATSPTGNTIADIVID